MCIRSFRLLFLLGAVLAGLAVHGTAEAQVTGTLGSNVDAYFGAQADAVQLSNPAGLNPWTPVGNNPSSYYVGLYQLPGVPSPPAGNVAPSNVTTFAPNPSTSSFAVSPDSAASTILGLVAGPSYSADAAMIDLLPVGMTLNEFSGTYDYEQLDFDIDFSVSSFHNVFGTTGTIGGLVNRTYSAFGSVGSFVAFGGEMNFYDWNGSTATSLGSPLVFNYVNNVSGGFSTTISGSTFVNAVGSPDVLRVTGDFFLIGDPATIEVQSVPEPSTLLLAAMAGIGLILAVPRRRALGH